jgi:probable H4MPT-linked C1 transfer pathway protein
LSILDAAVQAAEARPVSIWGLDGRFHELDDIRSRPALAAAANWLALAVVAARLIPAARGILIDVGSTTTDLIPLRDGAVAARGRTDTERLETGELVYAGVRRTPLCSLATQLPLERGRLVGLAAELFASTLDVFLTLGDLEPDPLDLATSDGRPATLDAARDRLARMVCADRDGFSTNDALTLSRSAEQCLIGRMTEAAERACAATIGRPEVVVIAGSGEFLARRVATALAGPDCAILGLGEIWGGAGSTAGCARALLQLTSEPGE